MFCRYVLPSMCFGDLCCSRLMGSISKVSLARPMCGVDVWSTMCGVDVSEHKSCKCTMCGIDVDDAGNSQLLCDCFVVTAALTMSPTCHMNSFCDSCTFIRVNNPMLPLAEYIHRLENLWETDMRSCTKGRKSPVCDGAHCRL